jgi:hypothetical protein
MGNDVYISNINGAPVVADFCKIFGSYITSPQGAFYSDNLLNTDKHGKYLHTRARPMKTNGGLAWKIF